MRSSKQNVSQKVSEQVCKYCPTQFKVVLTTNGLFSRAFEFHVSHDSIFKRSLIVKYSDISWLQELSHLKSEIRMKWKWDFAVLLETEIVVLEKQN